MSLDRARDRADVLSRMFFFLFMVISRLFSRRFFPSGLRTVFYMNTGSFIAPGESVTSVQSPSLAVVYPALSQCSSWFPCGVWVLVFVRVLRAWLIIARHVLDPVLASSVNSRDPVPRTRVGTSLFCDFFLGQILYCASLGGRRYLNQAEGRLGAPALFFLVFFFLFGFSVIRFQRFRYRPAAFTILLGLLL